MDLVGSILLLLRPWMGYNYIVIQVVCWVELLVQRRLCPIFFLKIWIPINGTQQCGIGSPEIHKNSVGCGLSTGPPDLGRHTASSSLTVHRCFEGRMTKHKK